MCLEKPLVLSILGMNKRCVIYVSSGLPEEFKEKLESLIASAMAQAHVPGLSLSMVKDDQVIYAKGFGARKLEENLPSTPSTLYGIGSCTKSFTAMTIMQLMEQGKLDLHDSVKKYIPEFKLGKVENPITVRHLLAHSSGVPNLGLAEILLKRFYGIDEKWIPMSSLDDLLLHINGAKEEVAAEPGKRFFYFNSGYTLLGEIIERASGMKYENYVKEKILNPLKMNRSTFLREDFEKDPDVMTPYFVESKEGKVAVTAARHPFHKLIYAPGGLLSSVLELANYLVANVNGGLFEGSSIIDASSLEEMHKIQIETPGPSYFGKTGYGYGWAIKENFLGHKLVEHGGSTGVSSAVLAFVPHLKIGVIMASNMGGGPASGLIPLAIVTLLMGKDPETELPALQIEKKLSMLTGVYESYKGINRISVVNKGGLLYVEAKERPFEMVVPLIPESEKIENLKFYILAGGQKNPVEFTLDSSGKIDLYIESNRFHKI